MKSSTLEAIYSSKMYKSSPRKSAIKAALLNVANEGLVEQVAEALDTEYRYLADDPSQPNEEALPDDLGTDIGDDFDVDRDTVGIDDFGGGRSSGGGSHLPPPPDFSDDGSSEDSEDLDTESEPDVGSEDTGSDTENADAELESALEAPVEESTKITSCTEIDTSTIKGSLNSREDTAGVNRVLTKENELWIYYNDDINLNNVMTPVIEYLNASGQTYLEFNRLARSDNAIVFVINDQPADVAPLESVEASKSL